MQSLSIWLLSMATLAVAFPSHTMVPLFMWSDLRCADSEEHRVDYQIASLETLVETAGKFSKQCSSPDTVVAIIGNQLRSVDLGSNGAAPVTANALKDLIAESNSSLSLPYIALPNDGSSLTERVAEILRAKNPEMKSVGCEKILSALEIREDYLTSATAVQRTLICSSAATSDAAEGMLLRKIASTVRKNYVIVYTSDPWATNEMTTGGQRRQLIGTSNSSSNGTYCDDVCRTKATLLEAIFVTIVLLVILVSGLCCMMGIQTPSRFETPHEL